MKCLNEGDIVRVLKTNYVISKLKDITEDNHELYGIINTKHNEYMYGVRLRYVQKKGKIIEKSIFLVPSEMKKANEEDLEKYEQDIKKLSMVISL